MNRGDRLAMALTQIVDMERVTRTGLRDPNKVFMEIDRIAREALDHEVPWPGEVRYNAPEDHAIARRWMERHEKADELVFVQGRPILALYYEPVAEHYQGARQTFRKLAEQLRAGWEEEWYVGD